MSHVLDLNADGTANLVLNRLPGWHGLGTVWQPGDAERLNLDLAMTTGRLAGWDVRAIPAFATDLNDDTIDSDYRMTVRNNPTDPDAPAQPLGMVGQDYTVVQNEEAFKFGENLLDEGLEVEAAGALRGGREVFVLFRIPQTITIGNDSVVPYLHIATRHDGTMAVTTKTTGVRVVCGNTQRMSLTDGLPMFKVRHTGDALDGQIAAAREALGVSLGTLDQFEKDMDRWLNTPVADFNSIIEANWARPEQDDLRKAARWEKRAEELTTLWTGPTNANITGTAWGALQTLTEWSEWEQGRDGDRAARAISPLADAKRERYTRNIADLLHI